jgi:hypothetical protein
VHAGHGVRFVYVIYDVKEPCLRDSWMRMHANGAPRQDFPSSDICRARKFNDSENRVCAYRESRANAIPPPRGAPRLAGLLGNSLLRAPLW